MSYPEKDNPYKRSWANPPPDMTGIIRILSDISSNSVTSYKERHEASEKFRLALEDAQKRETEFRLTHPSFSLAEREALAKDDYIIYKMHGVSLKKMLDDNHVIRTWKKGLPFEEEISFLGEAAINPYRIALWDTDGKNFAVQKKVFEKFRKETEKSLPGVTAKIATFPDLVDIELSHKSRHGRGILDRYYTGGLRTQSEMGNGYFAVINTSFMKRLELNVSYFKETDRGEFVGLAAIIVPKGINFTLP